MATAPPTVTATPPLVDQCNKLSSSSPPSQFEVNNNSNSCSTSSSSSSCPRHNNNNNMMDFASGPFALPSIASFAPLFETKGIPQPPPSMLYSDLPKAYTSTSAKNRKASKSNHSTSSSASSLSSSSSSSTQTPLIVKCNSDPMATTTAVKVVNHHNHNNQRSRRKPSQAIESTAAQSMQDEVPLSSSSSSLMTESSSSHSSSSGVMDPTVASSFSSSRSGRGSDHHCHHSDETSDRFEVIMHDPFAIGHHHRRQDQFQTVPQLPSLIDPYNLPPFYSFFRHERGLVDHDGCNKDVGHVIRLDERMKYTCPVATVTTTVTTPTTPCGDDDDNCDSNDNTNRRRNNNDDDDDDDSEAIRVLFTIHEVTKQYFPEMKLQCWLCETVYGSKTGQVDSSGLSVLLDLPVPSQLDPCLLGFHLPSFTYTGPNFGNENVRQFFRFVLINATTNTIVSFVDSALFSLKLTLDQPLSIDQQAEKKLRNGLESFQAFATQLGRVESPPSFAPLVSVIDRVTAPTRTMSNVSPVTPTTAPRSTTSPTSNRTVSPVRLPPPPPSTIRFSTNIDELEQVIKSPVSIGVHSHTGQEEWLQSGTVPPPQRPCIDTVKQILLKTLTKGKWHKMLSRLEQFLQMESPYQGTTGTCMSYQKKTLPTNVGPSSLSSSSSSTTTTTTTSTKKRVMTFDPTLMYPNKRMRYVSDFQQFITKPTCILSLNDSYGPITGGTSVQIFVNELDLVDLDGLSLRFGSSTVSPEDLLYVSPNEIRCMVPSQFEEGNYDVSLSVQDEVSAFSIVAKEAFKYVTLGQYINRKRDAHESFCTEIVQTRDPMLLFTAIALDESLRNVTEPKQLYSVPRRVVDVGAGETASVTTPTSRSSESVIIDNSPVVTLKILNPSATSSESSVVDVKLNQSGARIRVVDGFQYEIYATFNRGDEQNEPMLAKEMHHLQWFIRNDVKSGTIEPMQISRNILNSNDNRNDDGREIIREDESNNDTMMNNDDDDDEQEQTTNRITLRIPVFFNDQILNKYRQCKKLILQLVNTETRQVVFSSKNVILHTRRQYNRSVSSSTPSKASQENQLMDEYMETIRNQSRQYVQHVQSSHWNAMGQSPLHRACFSGSVREIEGAIREGYSCKTCDYFDRTPMHYAFAAGYSKAAKILLRQQPESIETLLYQDFYYLTPFHLGVKYRRIEFLDDISDFIRSELNVLFAIPKPAPIITVTDLSECDDEGKHTAPVDESVHSSHKSSTVQSTESADQTALTTASLLTPESPCATEPCSEHCNGDCPPLPGNIVPALPTWNQPPTHKTPNLPPISTIRSASMTLLDQFGGGDDVITLSIGAEKGLTDKIDREILEQDTSSNDSTLTSDSSVTRNVSFVTNC